MKEKHLMVGNLDNNCEFCNREFSDEAEELVSDVDGCEIYAHKKCYERARMLLELFKDAHET